LGMIQKQGNWVPYELKLRNVERRFFTCEMLLARHKRKGFLHRIVVSLVVKNGSTTITQRRENHGDQLAMLQCIDSQAEYSWKKTYVVYLVGSAWCRVLQVAQTERDRYWDSLPNTIDEIEPSTQGKMRPLLLQA